MGNCCVAASSMEWDGEDWSDLKSTKTRSSKVFDECRGNGHGLCLGKVQKEKVPDANANGKVKMVISKKELAQLLGKPQIGKKSTSAEAVLLHLIKAKYQESRHELWRPVLETIPEVS